MTVEIRHDYIVGWQQAHQFLRVGCTARNISAKHLDTSRNLHVPLTCSSECDACPWVDSWDFDQCGATINRHEPETIAS